MYRFFHDASIHSSSYQKFFQDSTNSAPSKFHVRFHFKHKNSGTAYAHFDRWRQRKSRTLEKGLHEFYTLSTTILEDTNCRLFQTRGHTDDQSDIASSDKTSPAWNPRDGIAKLRQCLHSIFGVLLLHNCSH